MADRKSHEELVVITKTYDLILWSCHHTGKFPRNHRFVLGERIERNLYDLLGTLIRAKRNRQRQELLVRANPMLEIMRFQVRLAKVVQCLKVESYGFAEGHRRGRQAGGRPAQEQCKQRMKRYVNRSPTRLESTLLAHTHPGPLHSRFSPPGNSGFVAFSHSLRAT